MDSSPRNDIIGAPINTGSAEQALWQGYTGFYLNKGVFLSVCTYPSLFALQYI